MRAVFIHGVRDVRVGDLAPPDRRNEIPIAVSAVGAYVCVWFAAKIFRVGLLMYGKPPSLGEILRWVKEG